MKWKKIAAFVLAVGMSASAVLTGCGAKGSEAPKNENTDANAKPEAEEQAEGTDLDAPSAAGKIQISFLNGFTGGDGAYMRKITDGFNASQEKYQIVEHQEKDHYLKFKSGNYDMVVIHGDRLKTYVEDEMLQEVSPIYEKAGLSTDDFAEAGKNIVTVDNGVFAFPLDIHPLTMFYNKEFVKEVPKTYEDLLKLQKELQAKDKNLYAMGVPGSGLVEFYYMALATQNGVNVQNGEALNFATEEFADVLMQYHKMIFEDKISPAKLGLDGEFKTFVQDTESGVSSQTAIALTGPWFYGAAKEKYGDNLGVAPIPVLGKNAGTYGNAHTIAVSAKVQDEEIKAGIAEFLKYLYVPENLINWADAGQAPLHHATMDYIKQNAEQYPLAAANIEQFANCKIAPQVYNVGEQTKYINETVFNLVVSTENLTKEQLMKELEKATKMAGQISEDK